MSDDLRYVGKSYPVHDVAQKVTGELIYGSDLNFPGMLYAKLLLSPIAHGMVRSVDSSRAEALPGVLKVFSHLNSPADTYCRARLYPGQECAIDETLFSEHVRFVGDRVAAVVAISQAIAEAAVALIEVDYEELPALLTTKQALERSDVLIHADGNLLFEMQIESGERPDISGAVLVSSTTATPRVHHAALEPHVCVAQGHSTGGMTVWTTSQGAYGVRTVIADLLGLEYHKVRVIKAPMGGSFGGKTEFIVEPVTAFLAHETRRTVKLLFDREECIRATMVRPATETTIRTACAPDGQLLELEATTTLDSGGYASSTPDYADHMCKKVTKLYRLPHYDHRCQVVYTNTPVAGAARGWGAPEMITAVEIHLAKVAKRLRIDPVELRLKNLVQPFDIDPVTDMSLGDARVAECLERGAAAFDWTARRARATGKGRYRRGVGVACGAHKNGQFGSFAEASNMALKMNEDGTFELSASLHEPGCGVVTVMKIIVAEVLGVHPDLIAASEADTSATPFDYGTFGSRMTYVVGACAQATATELKASILAAAAEILETPLEELVAREGVVYVAGDERRSVAFRDIARLSHMKHVPAIQAATTYYATSNPGSYSVQFAEVEVDCATGLTAVTDFLAVGDVGRAINRGMVKAQFQGAVQMGIGYALYEHVDVDEAGRSGVDGFKNYHMVNAPDMPDIDVLIVEHEGDDGPFGAKSVGEVAMVPTAAAVVNAVNNALGTELSDLPLIPDRIIAALAANEGGEA
ncbi:MAG TPA: molybdopterin cofactor-binding domain-containing protein [Thermoleophilia bacterium]|nr:molybdopterin cofactor-binding domain-containing protein [Thermoleophilia bacterium]